MPFGSLKRLLGGAAKVAGAVLPGPVGLGAKALGGILSGGSSSRRPAPIPSMARNAAQSFQQQQPPAIQSFGGGGAFQVPNNVKRAAETALRGIGTFAAGASAGPAGIGAFNTLWEVGQTVTGNQQPARQNGRGLVLTSDLVDVVKVTEARAPKGYRVHTVTPSTAPIVGMPPGAKVGVKLGSDAARVLGVKRSKKPPISVGEWSAVKKADRAKKKTARVAKMAGNYVRATAPRTTTRKSR